jgi:hypothetical protein
VETRRRKTRGLLAEEEEEERRRRREFFNESRLLKRSFRIYKKNHIKTKTARQRDNRHFISKGRGRKSARGWD